MPQLNLNPRFLEFLATRNVGRTKVRRAEDAALQRGQPKESRRCCPAERAAKELASSSELSGCFLADARVGPSDHHYLPGKLHICSTNSTSKEFPIGKGEKNSCTILPNPRLRYTNSIQPQGGISLSHCQEPQSS